MSKILVIAPHPNDEVLGCGGSIARWKNEGVSVHVLLMADGEGSRDGTDLQSIQDRSTAAVFANGVLGTDSLQLLNMPDNRLDGLDLLDVVKLIERYVTQIRPDTILTHHPGDVNIDHRIVHDAVIATCRPQPGFPVRELLFFETPSSTEWRPPTSCEPFVPNYFVDISDTLDKKLDALEAYGDELREFPHPRSIQAVEALARWRGATVGVLAAEAFVLGRSII